MSPKNDKPNTISRREFLKTAATGLAGASVLAASGVNPVQAASRKRTSARPATVKLVFWQHQDTRLDAATLEKIEEYKKVAPNVEIEFQ
ncbi:MAG: twin-arginine translocation signal domain-containing protein [Anaerolineae bacterium]|nr:twin-arginine translocation signal domain-containing protein [Anaerolineae bacterium]